MEYTRTACVLLCKSCGVYFLHIFLPSDNRITVIRAGCVVTASLLLQKNHRCAQVTWVTPSERELIYHEAVEGRTCTHKQFPGGGLLSLLSTTGLGAGIIDLCLHFPPEDMLYAASCHAAVPLKNLSEKIM